jgi:hypothetical protein
MRGSRHERNGWVRSIAPVVAFLLLTSLSLACGCGSSGGSSESQPRSWPEPPPGSTFYSEYYDLPQTQSAQDLASWMSSEHLEYSLDGWFFFGSLQDAAAPGDPGAFILSMQRIEVPENGQVVNFVPAICAYNNTALGQYVYGGAETVDVAPLVSVTSDPWKVEVRSPGQAGPLMTMELASGTMGQPAAEYLLKADIQDQLGGRLQAEVLISDRLGAVNQGYGTASFFPQFVTASQKNEITGSYGNSVRAYLEDTADPMTDQGSFYYSTPLMDVERFTITRDGVPLSSGTGGTMWMDDIVQAYDQQAWDILANASWDFYSIMLPDQGAALMVIVINSATGTLPVATLFNAEADRTVNSALEGAESWPIDQVEVVAVPGAEWASPRTGQRYSLEHRIILGTHDLPADLTVRMARPDQEIVAGSTIKYEGLGFVEGTLGGKPVKGTAFVELQPVGHL